MDGIYETMYVVLLAVCVCVMCRKNELNIRSKLVVVEMYRNE